MNLKRYARTMAGPMQRCRMARGMVLLCCALAGIPATAQANEQADAERMLRNLRRLTPKPFSLGIHGFNYTDRVIESFSIDHNGGGNIAVSSPTSGGGGTTCCYSWYPDTTISLPVDIEWMRVVDGKDRWCKKTVMLHGPYPKKPFAIAVHFMPDGDIIPEITAGFPDVKLRLENFDDGHRKEFGNVIHDEKVATCRYGY